MFASNGDWEREDTGKTKQQRGDWVSYEKFPQILSAADPNLLNELVARARALLGDAFDELRDTYLRRHKEGAASERLHPLFALVEATRTSITSLDSARPLINGFQIIDLQQALGVIEPWRDDLAWPAIAHEIKTPANFDHAVVALSSATYLHRFGNEVTLLPPGSKRTPDFRIAAPGQVPINVEVKAPTVLQRRTKHLDYLEAAKIVKNALSQAGTGREGQLGPDGPALLIIGGVHMGQANCPELESAARAVLASGGVPAHLFGVLCVTTGTSFQGLVATEQEDIVRAASPAGACLHATLTFGTAINPRYSYDGRAGILWPKQTDS